MAALYSLIVYSKSVAAFIRAIGSFDLSLFLNCIFQYCYLTIMLCVHLCIHLRVIIDTAWCHITGLIPKSMHLLLHNCLSLF